MLIALLLPLPRAGAAAEATPAPAPQLQITILDGEGALNNIRDRTAREPIIQVTDENHKPVSEAAVLFLIHDGPNGAGGSFGQAGVKSLNVKTDALGQAHGTGLTPNQTSGSFTIEVVAIYKDQKATVMIHQSNRMGPKAPVAPAGHMSPAKRVIIIGTVIGVGVGIGIGVWLSNRGSSTSITTGPGGVNPPTAVGVRIPLGHSK
jgi:hypothetical protein